MLQLPVGVNCVLVLDLDDKDARWVLEGEEAVRLEIVDPPTRLEGKPGGGEVVPAPSGGEAIMYLALVANPKLLARSARL
jgi:hypothetical protein